MEQTLLQLSENIEVITNLAQKTLDELTEMMATIEEEIERQTWYNIMAERENT